MKYFFKKNLAAFIIGIVLIGVTLMAPWLRDSVYSTSEISFASYDIQVQIEDDGDIVIQETIVGRFAGGMHAFFRDLPYSKNSNNQVGNLSSFDTSSVIVRISNPQGLLFDSSLGIANQGTQVGYSWNNDRDEYNDLIRCPSGYGNQCVSIFTYVPFGISPTTTYTFQYRIRGAVSTYADIAELNWKFYDPLESIKINNVTVNIQLPSSVSDVDEIYFFGHGSKNGRVDAITLNSISFSYPQLYADDIIEMRLLFPGELIVNPRSGTFLNEDKLDYFLQLEANIARADRFYYYFDYVLFALFIGLIFFLLWMIYLMYRRHDQEHKSSFYGEYYRELPAKYPPAEMGYLYNFKDIGVGELSATLMDLVRRGYIQVDYQGQSTTDKNADYQLILNQQQDRTSLKPYEEHLLRWYFEIMPRDKGKISLKEIENYAKNKSTAQKYLDENVRWTNHVKTAALKNDFFDEASEQVFKKNKKWIIIVTVVSIAFFFYALNKGMDIARLSIGFSIALLVVMSSYFIHIKRRSIQGNDEYVKWNAFKKFLSEFSRFDDYPLPSIVIWEHYLVYAVAFGIADLVQKQLNLRYENRLPEDYRRSPFTRYSYMPTYMMVRISASNRGAQQTVQKMKSGGQGGRGGFGGGRSFGGGGGGFRGR